MKKAIFLAINDFMLSENESSEARTFSGVANSGEPFNYHGVMSIIEFKGLSFKDKIPALDAHNRAKRVGVAELSVANNQLLVNGTLLANEHGQAIASDAEQGFPWELSVHVQAGHIEDVRPGVSVNVNGKTHTGPLQVMRGSTIREVSFTPVGVDAGTQAVVLSDDGEQSDKAMTLKEALEKIKTLESENADLKEKLRKSESDGKKSKLDGKLSGVGFNKNILGDFENISGESYDLLLSMSEAQMDIMIADMFKPKTIVPPALLCETTPPNGDGSNLGTDELDNILINKGVMKP